MMQCVPRDVPSLSARRQGEGQARQHEETILLRKHLLQRDEHTIHSAAPGVARAAVNQNPLHFRQP